MKEKELLGFVDTQHRNKTLKMRSQEYKQIKSDLVDFTSKMQNNPLAHSLTFEGRPFREIEKMMKKEMLSVNWTMVHGNESVENKEAEMKQFVLRVMDHYESKVKWS